MHDNEKQPMFTSIELEAENAQACCAAEPFTPSLLLSGDGAGEKSSRFPRGVSSSPDTEKVGEERVET
ncbi:hypothetical protein EYF80_044127 [Liparis tanakae]|uniref:Uncharacterized protein n=1 Tax=Liparis tanakae TaxID=230148 RepID=A0A4Z2FWQ5_9TELE|nr:hypothetical protein EYF80_044127 [Liparis tanakae]